MFAADLPTPALLVEHDRLTHNLGAMQARAAAQGVALRPHVKTHKSARIAEMQRDLGAEGLTVAKPAEAEVFAAAGFRDLRLAYPVAGQGKHERLASLKQRGARVSFCVDTAEGADLAAAVYRDAGQTADVLIEVDEGYGRSGVRWDSDRLDALVRHVQSLEGLTLVGLLTHGGGGYAGPQQGETPVEALQRAMRQERDRLLQAAARLVEADLLKRDGLELSLGSTPTLAVFENTSLDGLTVTEIRPGTYALNDAQQVALGAAQLTDCALTVLATVVSRQPGPAGTERVILDAGRKILTSDTGAGTAGYGVLLHSAETMKPLPHARLMRLSEEHGWVSVPGGSTFAVGDTVRIVPNHACTAVNTQSTMWLVEGETVQGEIAVDARGAVT